MHALALHERESAFELTSNSPDDRRLSKSWGWVAAKPSEFLIVYRKGTLSEELCGQGARVWKRPSDTIAIVPTTLKEVVFQANQITGDNVDVRLRGMLLYRIIDPLRIYKLINFTSRSQAEAKLARMLADMCRSTAKWLVANMTLEECNRRRKEEIAGSLKREVAAVATEGWGVEIVTIDIQDVFIQDQRLFEALQASYRLARERDAQLAAQALKRRIEEQRIADERALVEQRHALTLETAELAAAAEFARLELQTKNEEEQFRIDRLRVEQNEAIAFHKIEQEQLRQRALTNGAHERAQTEAESERVRSDQAVHALRERLAAESTAGRASLERLFLTDSLPALANALAKSLEGSRLHVYQSGEGGATPLSFALTELTGLLGQRLAGLPEDNAAA